MVNAGIRLFRVRNIEYALDEAFEWLNRSIALGNENTAWFERDPTLASLRDDPKFKQLLERIRVAP